MWAHAYVPRHLLETRLAMFGKDGVLSLFNKLRSCGGVLYLRSSV